MPATGAALVIAICALPGYLYLQRTAEYRRPESRSPVSELLHVLLVSLVTTGIATSFLAYFFSEWSAQLLEASSKGWLGLDAAEIKRLVLSVAVVALTSMGLAWLLSSWTRHQAGERFAPSVSQATLGQRRPGHLRYLSVGLADGNTVDGVLHAYTLGDNGTERAIALKPPMRRVTSDGQVAALDADSVLLFGEGIQHVIVRHVPDVGSAATPPS